MSSPNDPDRPAQGWTPAWDQSAPQQSGAPGWTAPPQPAGWDQQPQHEWPAQPQPAWPAQPQSSSWDAQQPSSGWGTSPAPAAPAQQAPSSPLPVPPAPLVVAAVLTLLAVVGVVVAAVVGGPGDLLTEAGWLDADADAVPALLAVLLVAALVGGVVAALAGRGGGLLRTAGIALAVLAAAVAVGSALTDEVDGVRIGLAAALALAGIALAVLAGLAPSTRWYAAAERRSAERVVAGVLARPVPGRDQVAGTGAGWAVAAAVLAVATVGAAALVVGGLTGDGDDGDSGLFGTGPGEIPVDVSDPEYDPTLHDLAEDCRDGDLDACDTLYFQTPVGSEYEQYGTTCGARTEEEFYGTCAAEFD